MPDYTIVFVHGYTSSSKKDWYPAISKELQKYNIKFVIPNLPGGKNPHVSEWLRSLHDVISKINTPIVFVGHSLGTRAVLLYLEKYKLKVKKVFLIAAFANNIKNANRHDDGKSYEDFFEHSIDISSIKILAEEFIVLHSVDDSSVGYSQGESIVQDLNGEFLTFQGRDHFSNPDDMPLILKVLRNKLKF